VDLVLELIFAPVIKRIAFLRAPPSDDFLERVVDVVLAGAKSGAAVAPAAALGARQTARK
jgi:hypothetical protein